MTSSAERTVFGFLPTLLGTLALALGFPQVAQSQVPAGDPRPAAEQSGAFAEAVGQLRDGDYTVALANLRVLAREADARPLALRTYARALLEVGRYEDAAGALEERAGSATGFELENALGEAYYVVGRIRDAEAAFRRSMENDASDRYVARLNLGVLLWNRGDRGEALALFDSFIDIYNQQRRQLSPEDLMAVGEAVRYLGVTNSSLYQDALMAYDDAAAVDPDDLRPDLLAGELFLEKYRATDARDSFRPVLERNPRHPRALLGQARILDFEGVGGSVGLVRQALEANPRYADALAFLASLHLKTEDFDEARERVEEALDVNPAHLQALSVLAAIHFLEGDMAAYREVKDRALALNPAYPGLYTTVAEHAVFQRQYQTAVELAKQAVELDPSAWWSYGVLGMNQLRTGAVEEGRLNLEKAFAGDPYNPWYKNTLDLLDTFGHYEKVSTEHFEIFIHEREVELLGPYATETAEEAFAVLRGRYGAAPPTPIRLEIYSNHSDFSVRTLGITGLGALGVSFGSTLVMDSPSALDPGNFNWSSTMWHEIAHAFHLAMSDHRVPRWFTEGLAVHEQHRARSSWGIKASPGWLKAYEDGRLPPVSRLNQGFIRPEYPEQVIFSYYQASLVFDLIEDRWGLDAVLAMLRGYEMGQANAQVFQEVLGQSPGAFDEVFDGYVRERWGTQMAAVASPEEPGSFPARLSLGRALFEAGSYDEAEVEFTAALDLFPEYGGMDGPLWYLTMIHREAGELERAARALQRLGFLGETLYPAYSQEAELWMELGDKTSAATALENVVEIVPFDEKAHEDLAEIYEDSGEARGAVRERRAILALDPTDRAEAHYRLAAALSEAGDKAEARRQLLRALEIAPSYEAALELLLSLRGGGRTVSHVESDRGLVNGRNP